MPLLRRTFQSLILPLLGKSEAELARWRDALQEALGPNGHLIEDVVPELRFIIGEQPPVLELPPQGKRKRGSGVFSCSLRTTTGFHCRFKPKAFPYDHYPIFVPKRSTSLCTRSKVIY